MAGRKGQKHDVKKRLLEAARALAGTHPDEFDMATVIRAAGTSRRAMYTHWRTQEEFFKMALKDWEPPHVPPDREAALVTDLTTATTQREAARVFVSYYGNLAYRDLYATYSLKVLAGRDAAAPVLNMAGLQMILESYIEELETYPDYVDVGTLGLYLVGLFGEPFVTTKTATRQEAITRDTALINLLQAVLRGPGWRESRKNHL